MAACAIIGVIALPFAVITFGISSPPLPSEEFKPSSGPAGEIEWYQARDGTTLAVRCFNAIPRDHNDDLPVAILIHGSGSSSLFLGKLAESLADHGIVSYAPDWRGGGLSGQTGDIDYVGQLEDDLEDLLAWLRHDYPQSEFIYVGFSAGGSFGLRIADKAVGRYFRQIVAIAPYLGLRDPATRPNNAGGWAAIYTGRIIGLKILNSIGLRAFNRLPIIAFALPQDMPPEHGVRTYSYRMVENFNARGGTAIFSPKHSWRDDIRNAGERLSILFGDRDLGIDASKAEQEVKAALPRTHVAIIPDSDHVGLVQRPESIDAVVDIVLSRSASCPSAISA